MRLREWRRRLTAISRNSSSNSSVRISTADNRAAIDTIATIGEIADAVAINEDAVGTIADREPIRARARQWLQWFPTARRWAGMIHRATAGSFDAQRTAICPILQTLISRQTSAGSTISVAAIRSLQLPEEISEGALSSLK